VYDFIRKVLQDEYAEITMGLDEAFDKEDKKKKKPRKLSITMSANYYGEYVV